MFDTTDSLYYVKFTKVGNIGATPIAFKAYLEKSEITFTPEDIQLPVSPAAAENDKQTIKLIHNVSLTIKVFSENLQEARNNYIKLKNLIDSIKPKYTLFEGDLIPDRNNILGLLQVDFAGLPLTKQNLKIHLQSFSYIINKELGYIESPKVSATENKDKLYVASGMELIPLGFDISIVGRINFNLNDTAKIEGSTAARPVVSRETPAPSATATSASAAAPASSQSVGTIVLWLNTNYSNDASGNQKILNFINRNLRDLESKWPNLNDSVKQFIYSTIKNGFEKNDSQYPERPGVKFSSVPYIKGDGVLNTLDLNDQKYFTAGVVTDAEKKFFSASFPEIQTQFLNKLKSAYQTP